LAIVCVVQAPHRAEAFAACRWAVDAVKHGAPIWKIRIGQQAQPVRW
jgi:molybdopterin synthase catalytic subunit